jgi:flagellum-specific peptidoglycan hydrolase FlgJ
MRGCANEAVVLKFRCFSVSGAESSAAMRSSTSSPSDAIYTALAAQTCASLKRKKVSRRRSEYRRKKRQTDPEYAEVVRDSRRKWREAHPDYQKQYRQTNPEAVTRNRQQQRQRDQKRRVGQLVKNTLVFDLKRSTAEVWLLGPLAKNLEKNTLVSSKLLIFQAGATAPYSHRVVPLLIVILSKRMRELRREGLGFR